MRMEVMEEFVSRFRDNQMVVLGISNELETIKLRVTELLRDRGVGRERRRLGA